MSSNEWMKTVSTEEKQFQQKQVVDTRYNSIAWTMFRMTATNRYDLYNDLYLCNYHRSQIFRYSVVLLFLLLPAIFGIATIIL